MHANEAASLLLVRKIKGLIQDYSKDFRPNQRTLLAPFVL